MSPEHLKHLTDSVKQKNMALNVTPPAATKPKPQPPKAPVKQYVPPEVQALQELGRQGKLWTVEVVYTLDSNTKVVRKRNMTSDELMKFRESMFRFGFTVPVEPGHWKVVPPFDIQTVDMFKQTNYFAGV